MATLRNQFNIALSDDEAAVVLSIASEQDRPAAQVIRHMIREALAAKPTKNEA